MFRQETTIKLSITCFPSPTREPVAPTKPVPTPKPIEPIRPEPVGPPLTPSPAIDPCLPPDPDPSKPSPGTC